MSNEELRATFDEDAELYARARPAYPDELIADLAQLAPIGHGTRVLELGPGTGQATTALIARGAHVVGVELGRELARVLKRDLWDENLQIVVSAFEDWTLPGEPFDSVAAFTSWHWLDPTIRAAKVAAALRVDGALATVTTTHVAGGSTAFFADVQSCYERWDPATPKGLRARSADDIPVERDEVDDSERFHPAVRRRYQHDIAYTKAEYLALLSTYSGHRALPAASRTALLACIGDLIDSAHGGSITKRYLYELRVARTRGAGTPGAQ